MVVLNNQAIEDEKLSDIKLPPDYKYDEGKKPTVKPRIAGVIDFLNDEYGVYSYRNDFVNSACIEKINKLMENELDSKNSLIEKIPIADFIKMTLLVSGVVTFLVILFVLAMVKWGVIP